MPLQTLLLNLFWAGAAGPVSGQDRPNLQDELGSKLIISAPLRTRITLGATHYWELKVGEIENLRSELCNSNQNCVDAVPTKTFPQSKAMLNFEPTTVQEVEKV